MAHIVFYEKPGCGGNAKQKAMLMQAGHTLDVRSLLTEPWTADRLMSFFDGLPVARWFNLAAPKVKAGEVDPGALSADQALALMLADPLLIRRPLMEQVKGGQVSRLVGFETALVDNWVGLSEQATAHAKPSMEGCATAHPAATCKTSA